MSPPCKGNLGKLMALMDGTLRPRTADRMRDHLSRCPGCNTAYERMTKGQQLLREIGEEDPSEISWKHIEAQLHWKLSKEDKEPERTRRWSPMLALAGAAALGALIGILIFSNMGELFTDPTPGVTAPGKVAARPTAPVKAVDEELAAVVTMARGEVFLKSTRGDKAPLTLSRPLLQGDRAITDQGKLALQWEEGTGLRMVPHTELVLKKLGSNDQQLVLDQGKIYVQVSKRKPHQRFQVLADGIRATVKGTHLAVGQKDGQVEVEVFTGLVAVESVSGAWKSVDVPAGHRVQLPVNSRTRPTLQKVDRSPRVSLLNLQPWASFQRVMAETGLMSVRSHPPGAELRLDSRILGETNIQVRSTFARHLLELYRDGKLVHRKWVMFSPSMSEVVLNIPRPKRIKLSAKTAISLDQATMRLGQKIRDLCFDRLSKSNPKLQGTLSLRLSMSRHGRVDKVRLMRATGDSRLWWKCAHRTALRGSFPPDKDKQAYDVVRRFKFVPSAK